MFKLSGLSMGYLRFAFAKDFYHQDGSEFNWEPNGLEKLGNALRWGVGSLADLLIREIKNPITIIALTAIALLAVNIAFYPAQSLAILVTVVPFAKAITPAMLKFALYILVQSTALGVGLRTFGRLQNQQLVENWEKGSLTPIYIGSKKIEPKGP